MPYERWITADTMWLISLVVIPGSAMTQSEFQAGALTVIIAYLWIKHRERRKTDWFDEQDHQIRLRSIADQEDQGDL